MGGPALVDSVQHSDKCQEVVEEDELYAQQCASRGQRLPDIQQWELWRWEGRSPETLLTMQNLMALDSIGQRC